MKPHKSLNLLSLSGPSSICPTFYAVSGTSLVWVMLFPVCFLCTSLPVVTFEAPFTVFSEHLFPYLIYLTAFTDTGNNLFWKDFTTQCVCGGKLFLNSYFEILLSQFPTSRWYFVLLRLVQSSHDNHGNTWEMGNR